MKCPYCKGTTEECGCGEGKCLHCINGLVADPPCGQPKYVPQYLRQQDVTALVQYFNDPTRLDTIGEFLQRVGAAAVSQYKIALHEEVVAERRGKAPGTKSKGHAITMFEGIQIEHEAVARNQRSRERQERDQAYEEEQSLAGYLKKGGEDEPQG